MANDNDNKLYNLYTTKSYKV